MAEDIHSLTKEKFNMIHSGQEEKEGGDQDI